MKQQNAGRGATFTGSMIALATVLGTWQVQAQGTNSLPFVRSFESLSGGAAIVDINGNGSDGWTGTAFSTNNNAAEVVVVTPPTPPNGFPLPDETHTKVMQVLGDVAAEFDTALTPGITNVLIDTVVQAGQLAFEPDVPSGAQVAAYFNTNGQLVVRHAIYTNDFSQVLTRAWTELQHTPVASNEWVRLTIVMNYLGAGPIYSTQEHYYLIKLNGQTLTSPWAYTNVVLEFDKDGGGSPDTGSSFPNGTGQPSTGGPGTTNMWFLCADSGFGEQTGENVPNNAYITSIEFDGAGNVDDVVVQNADTTNGPPPCATAYDCWIAAHYPSCVPCRNPTNDLDADGASNFDEFVAGTSPTDASSTFEVRTILRTGTSNYIAWLGTTNSGNFSTFSVYRSTNLMMGASGWQLVATNIPRTASGTSSWYDVSPPTNGFYRPALPTNAP